MAIARVQRVTAAAFTNPVTATLSAATTGNLLVCKVFTKCSNAAFGRPSGFSAGVQVVNGTEDDTIDISYKVAAGGETAISVTNGDGEPTCVTVEEFSGITTSSPLDQTASTGRTAGVATISSGTTAALAQNDELGVVVCGIREISVTSEAFDASYDIANGGEVNDAGNAATMIETYKVISDGAAQQTDASWSPSSIAMCAIATFKAAAAGAELLPKVMQYYHG